MHNNNITVIGLVGQPSSGKDTAAHYLHGLGFIHISTGDMLREDMVKAGIQMDRPHMNEFAIAMRKKYGNSYPASSAVAKVVSMIESGDGHGSNGDKDGDNADSKKSLTDKKIKVVISGMRNTAEINVIRERFGERFILVAVEVPVEIRYERARARNRVGDNITFEQFKAQEDFEKRTADGTYQMDAMVALADKVVRNDADEAQFFARIDDCVKCMD